ncbi:MAG: class I SAM-dependent methyltransferase [Desulfobacteraceae bacterium]
MNLYESPTLRAVTGPAIRPGGFDLTDRGLARCRLAAGTRVLDIGCGTGACVEHLRRLHGLEAAGVDLSALLLEEGALKHRGLPLIRGRAEQLPATAGTFGAVVCECMLSLCPEPHAVLGEIQRVLQPGGFLLLTDVYDRTPGDGGWRDSVVYSCLRGTVDRATVERRVAAAGLEVVLWEDHTPLLKQLAAQLVWTFGSMAAFWSALGRSGGAGKMRRGETACSSRPGYFLVVARK